MSATTSSPIEVPTFSEPGLVPWACVDIETCDGSPDRIIPYLRRSWSEGASKKPEVIGQRFLDAALKEEDKLAVLPWAPIIFTQLCTPRGVWGFHCMGSQPTTSDVPGAVVHAADNPREMLIAFRSVCEDQIGVGTDVVGHNIKHFDLPRLRRAFVTNRVHMPAWLGRSDQPVFDSMRTFASAWAGAKHDDDAGRKRKMFASLDDVCDELGLERNDSPLCGAAVPEAYKEGRFSDIVDYGLRDVLVESRVYLAMTGLTREYIGLDLFSDSDRERWA